MAASDAVTVAWPRERRRSYGLRAPRPLRLRAVRPLMRRAIAALLVTAGVVYLLASFKPHVDALNAGVLPRSTTAPRPAATARATPTPSSMPSRRRHRAATAHAAATGDAVQVQYGILQLTATLTAGRLSDVTAGPAGARAGPLAVDRRPSDPAAPRRGAEGAQRERRCDLRRDVHQRGPRPLAAIGDRPSEAWLSRRRRPRQRESRPGGCGQPPARGSKSRGQHAG